MYRVTCSSAFVLAIVLLISATSSFGEDLDISGCATCDSLYTHWIRNRTISAYWGSHDSARAAGDHLCQWTADIYYGCYSTCAKDLLGNPAPYVATRKATVMKKYEDTHCLEGGCRLADTQSCTFSLPRKVCDDKLNCTKSVLEDSGCDKARLCTSAERRAYAQHIIDYMGCYLSFPKNKADGIPFTLPEVQGLQQCKDIIIVECIRSWSDDEYDLKYITNYSAGTKANFCSARKMVTDCVYAVSNSTVRYAQHSYIAPCKAGLLKHPEAVEEARERILHAYDRLCSDTDPCAEDVNQPKKGDADVEEEGSALLQFPKMSHIADGHQNKTGEHDHSSATNVCSHCGLMALTSLLCIYHWIWD